MTTERLTLNAARRDTTIKRSGKKTVAAGQLPGVVYGAKAEAFSIKLEPKALQAALRTEHGINSVFDLQMVEDGARHLCMVKDWQFDPVKRDLTHVDLYVVDPDQFVTLDIPVKPEGQSAGERIGGLLQVVSRTVKVRCRVRDIPVALIHDVTEVELGEGVYIDELETPPGCEILFKNRFPVIQVMVRRAAILEEGEGGEEEDVGEDSGDEESEVREE